jgi:hypothetical protein
MLRDDSMDHIRAGSPFFLGDLIQTHHLPVSDEGVVFPRFRGQVRKE